MSPGSVVLPVGDGNDQAEKPGLVGCQTYNI